MRERCLEELKKELLAFPNGRHDDQVDSISQFLNWAIVRGGRTTPQRRVGREGVARPRQTFRPCSPHPRLSP